MVKKFNNLGKNKRTRIINAAMREFARRGYKDGKTDTIARDAGISKGSLFHYFGSKKKLFLFLLDHAAEIFAKEFNQASMDEDIFERLRQNSLKKLEYYRQYPELGDFVASVYSKGPEELKDEILPRVELWQKKTYAMMYKGLDLSRFKDNIDPQVAFNIIFWTVAGLRDKMLTEYRDAPVENLDSTSARYAGEFEAYFSILKRSLYK